MQVTSKESVTQLENLVRDLSIFETAVMFRQKGRCRQARFTCSDRVIRVWMMGTSKAVNLEDAFDQIRNGSAGGELLIDTLTVRNSDADFLKTDDPLFLATRSAWISQIGLPVVSAKTPGPNSDVIKRFTEKLLQLNQFYATIYVRSKEMLRDLELTSYLSAPSDGPGQFATARRNLHVYYKSCPLSYSGQDHRAADAACGMAAAEHLINGGELLLDTLIVRTNQSADPTPGDDPVYQETRAYLCACAGMNKTPDHVPVSNAVQVRETELRNWLISCLTSGKDGVALWNELPDQVRRTLNLEKGDLKGQVLNGLKIKDSSFNACSFSTAKMKKVEAEGTKFGDCCFEKADLSGSKFKGVQACGADFTGANLQQCKFHDTDLGNANFKDANVAGADFKGANLQGVDLTVCNASEAKGFAKSVYDDRTRMPEGFVHWKELVWKGGGPDPYKMSLMKNQKQELRTELDFAGFMALLDKEYDKGRVSKAIAMLKKSTFELFSEQNDSGVVGIVKSQTDAELLYACKLGAEGTFACCTQNLNPCGGLRGALCKHILVLIIGLVNANQLDANEASHRVIASKRQAPTLNKELMTEVFLKYQGAESGEIDWRPTETIPEDYYAF